MRTLSKREELEAAIIAARAAGRHEHADQLEAAWLALRDGAVSSKPLVGADRPMRLRSDEERWAFAPMDEPVIERQLGNVYLGPHPLSRGSR